VTNRPVRAGFFTLTDGRTEGQTDR